jgi:hypothetical protein
VTRADRADYTFICRVRLPRQVGKLLLRRTPRLGAVFFGRKLSAVFGMEFAQAQKPLEPAQVAAGAIRELVMPKSEFIHGNHTYRLRTVRVTNGWTFEIVHRVRTGDDAIESVHSPGIAYTSEEAAMTEGTQVVADMTAMQKD